MRTIRRFQNPIQLSFLGLAAVALIALGFASCSSSRRPTRRTETNLEPGWPKANNFFHQVSYRETRGTVPEIPGAQYVNDDELCATCHGAYHAAFVASNAHRDIHLEGQGGTCESCHGPASRHMETRGKEPGLIINFKQLSPADQSEVCLQCHEENRCAPGAQWRNSKHAACGVSCVSCHTSHYDVPPGTPATTEPGEGPGAAPGGAPPAGPIPPGPVPPGPVPPGPIPPGPIPPPPAPPNQTFVPAQPYPPLSWTSHEQTLIQRLPVIRGQSGGTMAQWAVMQNGQTPQRRPYRMAGKLGAVSPYVCYQCHTDMRQYQQLAGPHQILGHNGFNCTTCHDSHGNNIKEFSRQQLCLQCHKDAPTMAWHSSTHNMVGVACTDCHNPHPDTRVQRFVNVSHTDIRRPHRRQMSVEQPEVCYKCHQKIFAKNAMPSHHPIKEGKMVCSDCHDAHGQEEGNLKDASVNLVCYKCHADKQGPFVWEHPPVTENCAICHEPHGTVANNLLRQPTTFLCLRCHVGHRGDHGGGFRTGIDQRPTLQAGFYTDCTQCHAQIHGSDFKGNGRFKDFMR